MNNIKILDCTLRDGGYVNNWNFGENVIKKIISNLVDANIDIIECGFLKSNESNLDFSLYGSIEKVNSVIPLTNNKIMFVGMIALGEKEISCDEIPDSSNSRMKGIRITFHKDEIDRATYYANNLIEKGYKIFLQPVGTISYSDLELLELAQKVNEINPYAFYIVDTLGTIVGTELLRFFSILDANLKDEIHIGFHPHNNLQLAFSNSQELLRVFTNRNIIIDSSVFGMGRGAGNLCTELITRFINENFCHKYNELSILRIIDKYIQPIYIKNSWGYSAPYYISAKNKCHPNYAINLINRQSLDVLDIEKILREIPQDKKTLYDSEILEDLYYSYQNNNVDDKESIYLLKQNLKDKLILVIAPGKNIKTERNKIEKYIKDFKPIIITVNFGSENFNENYIFVSNIKRYESLHLSQKSKIITSNIAKKSNENEIVFNYSSYINDNSNISDNAGLMLVKLLIKLEVSEINLAGFDGFSEKPENNYFEEDFIFRDDLKVIKDKNSKIADQLNSLSKQIRINLITTSKYKKIIGE